ncbi:MAG: hypothetical protein AB1659_01745 [Thermodesulfobacteriota bacterium]
MGIVHSFNTAQKIRSSLTRKDDSDLRELCSGIQNAETELISKAAPLLNQCAASCQGLCCRNIVLDTIIGLSDFIYILSLDPSFDQSISACLEDQSFLYSSNCIFLSGGRGPCIFPPTIRPQLCITTFCSDNPFIRRELTAVKKRFFALEWFICLKNVEMLGRKIMAFMKRSQ